MRLVIKSLKTILFSNYKQLNHFRQCSCLQESIRHDPLLLEDNNPVQKVLKVAVIGMPNVGKSTFINNLMDRKVCPASAKVHTTRTKAKAIFTDEDSQIIFLDTPGLVTDRIKRRYNLEDSFVIDSETCLKQADTIGVVHDVSDAWTREKLDIKIIKLLEKHETKPSFLILNKVDVLKSKRKLLEITRLITMNCIDGKQTCKKSTEPKNDNRGWPYFKEVFMVSALTGNGLEHVRSYLLKCAKPGKWLYPAEKWTDQKPEHIILNTVKATLLDFLPQEIPYRLKPIMELYEVTEDGDISTVVIVKCPSEHIARLVAGASNGKLRQMTERTQKDLQEVFHQFVNIRIVLQPSKNEK